MSDKNVFDLGRAFAATSSSQLQSVTSLDTSKSFLEMQISYQNVSEEHIRAITRNQLFYALCTYDRYYFLKIMISFFNHSFNVPLNFGACEIGDCEDWINRNDNELKIVVFDSITKELKAERIIKVELGFQIAVRKAAFSQMQQCNTNPVDLSSICDHLKHSEFEMDAYIEPSQKSEIAF
ncbi:hypothetical protein [Chitinophaga sp. YR573]|uniref:hypothetical protein n=1 Tax=Chitinophaga sp. YR573 TaxID=1881040 RepID=UPI00115FFBB0|nr:hypothetical protein [Chitinophaga sp. YR573]